MPNGSCDVTGCTQPTLMGRRPLTERLGRQICEGHWRRHQDPEDDFGLFEAFSFRRPVGIQRPLAKKEVARCACGRERLPGHKFCTDCAQDRERQRMKEAYHERKNGAQQEPAGSASSRPFYLSNWQHNYSIFRKPSHET